MTRDKLQRLVAEVQERQSELNNVEVKAARRNPTQRGHMKLANHERATVPQAKITGYLLSATHRDGRHKAAFFTRFGFTAENWQELAAALLQHAADHEVAKEEDTPFGKRYVIEGTMKAPDGRTPWLRSVWFIETDAEVPRFVTAYPLRREGDD